MSVPNTTRPVSELDDHELGIEYHRLEFRWMLAPDRDHSERIRDASRIEAICEERARRRDAKATRACGDSSAGPSSTRMVSPIQRPVNPSPSGVEFRGGKVVRR